MLLHYHGGDHDGKTEGRGNADENEGHFPLFDEGDYEGGEKHSHRMD